MSDAVRFHDLTLGYDRHPAVHHLDGSIAHGALLAVTGPNGAGKSTLFKAIAGLIKPLAGEIVCAARAARDIAYLPQAADIDRSFPIHVHDMIAMGLWRTVGMFGAIGPSHRAKIAQAIAAVGLTGFENRQIGKLSGGQMQRVLFARLMLQDASLIVLDEPLNAVDGRTAEDLLALMRRWHEEGRTIIAALHDLDLIRAHFPDVLLLAREEIAWGPTRDVLTSDNLRKARRMCEAFDDGAETCADDAPALAS